MKNTLHSFFKSVYEQFWNLRISKKIMFCLLAVALVPIVCIMLVSYFLSASVIQTQTRELIQANLHQSAGNIEHFWDTHEDIIKSIYIDDFYREQLEPMNKWNTAESYDTRANLIRKMENIVNTNADILGIWIVAASYDNCFYDRVMHSSQTSYCFDVDHVRNNELIEQAFAAEEFHYSSLKHISNREYGSRDVLYMSCQLKNFQDLSSATMGCVILCIEEAELEKIYQKSSTESNVTFGVDEQGNLVSASCPQGAGLRLSRYLDKAEGNLSEDEIREASVAFVRQKKLLGGKHLQVLCEQIINEKFWVVSVQDEDYVLRDFRYLILEVFLFGAFVVIICILISISFSDRVNHEVRPILKAMSTADKGNLDVSIEVEGEDEFAIISRQFNQMISQIRLSRQQEKEALLRQKNAEIKSLEAQINPHFLYNTLDAINWVALERQEYTVSRMLTSLAAILRYSIQKSNEEVEVGDEIEYLKKYVYLQQQRFDYSFVCAIHASEEVRQCRIHKLLVQPLLENTLVHAFPGYTGMDEVQIRFAQTDPDHLQITITDNGIGMKQEQVDEFNQFDYHRDTIQGSIGVRNVITRIKLYYGAEGRFHISSGEEGTQITIAIPYRK